MNKSLNLMGYRIASYVPNIDIEQKAVINTINPHSYVIAKQDDTFKEALQQSDYLLPDGIGIVYAAKVIKGENIPRISGPDFHKHLLSKLDNEGRSCFYLGSSNDTLANIENRLSNEYPNLRFKTFSPPYKEFFSDDDTLEMIKAVNAFNPDVLFVGLTAPKQEKWVYQNKDKINATVICSIGAAFDFFAGTRQRSSDFWKKWGLEWLPRFLKEPKRLWRRNIISTPLFLFEVAKHKFRL